MEPPEWIQPMAATLTQERFTGADWIFERKFDGIRLLAYKRGPDVRLYSRNRLPQDIPAIADAIAALPVDNVILDGEVTWHPSTREDGDAGSGRSALAYHVFDIMWLGGRSVMEVPLEERLGLLRTLPLSAPLRRVEALDDPAPWERAAADGWEGVIAKRRDSPYEQRRSKLWLKMKCEETGEFVVGGFTDPQGGRVGLGALLVGQYQPDAEGPMPNAEGRMQNAERDFVFAGKVGTGFDTKLLLGLRARLDASEIPKPPFTKSVGLPRVRAHWVRPEIVVRVAFIEWTVHGKLRHSRLLGVAS
jgi:bifunctional non-homologous end joining protein LigD